MQLAATAFNLAGITKKNILKSLKGKLDFQERDVHVDELNYVTEAFMSSTSDNTDKYSGLPFKYNSVLEMFGQSKKFDLKMEKF